MNELFFNLKTHIVAAIAIIIAFFAPIAPLLIIVAIAIFADTILGIIKAYKRKQKITSRRMSAIVSKMFLYQFTVLSVFIFDKYLIGELIGIFTDIQFVATKLVTLTLLFIELKSVNENIEAAFKINIWASLKKMVARAKEVKDDLEELTEGKKEEE